MSKPVIRLYFNMARSGGTIISRCLGSMVGVVLLSEIHPLGLAMYNPVVQADQWFDLFTEDDKKRLVATGSVDYLDIIALIRQRCEERQKTLLIRDWSHLDFTGVPFITTPAYEPTHRTLLQKQFDVIHTASVRHPIDQWLSLRRLSILQGKIDLDTYLTGYLRFAEFCSQIGFIRYEDFTRNPDEAFKALCANLDIHFDLSYRERWSRYTTITGDIKAQHLETEILPRPRHPMEPNLLERFAGNANYRRAIDILGYDHPE